MTVFKKFIPGFLRTANPVITAAGLLFLCTQAIFSQDTLCESCVEYTLELKGDKLTGSSMQFPGYDISMILPSGFSPDSLDKANLFRIIQNNDIRGEFISPGGRFSEIRYSLVPYRDTITVFMKTSNGWYPWETLRFEKNKVIFVYDFWYCPPATETDLEIVNLSLAYLNDSTNWHQEDDRKCEDDASHQLWSLFCAMKMASIEITGEYNHRGKINQTARFVIDELRPGHNYAHTLMDFNNDPTTRFGDVTDVLYRTKERVQKELGMSDE